MEKPLLFEDCVLVENKIYFVGYNIAVLFSMDINTGEIEYIDRIPNTMIIQCRSVTRTLFYQNKLFLIPGRTNCNYVWTFDLGNRVWNALEFKNEGIYYPYEKFSYATIYENELFMVGCYYPGIVCIDLNDNNIQYYNIFPNNMSIHSLEDCILVNGKIYIPDPNGNRVSIFDVNNKELQCVQIGNDNNTYGGITKNGEKFWLAPFKGKSIVQWDGKTDIQEYELPLAYENMNGFIFKGITSHADNVYCMGLKEKKSFKFANNEYQKNDVLDTNYLVYKELNTNTFLLGDYEGNIQIISEAETKKYTMQIAKGDFQSFISMYKSEVSNKVNFVQEEDFFWNINDFISLVK